MRQGRRGGKPLRQDEEATFERLALRHCPEFKDDGISKSISEFRKQLVGLKHYTASL